MGQRRLFSAQKHIEKKDPFKEFKRNTVGKFSLVPLSFDVGTFDAIKVIALFWWDQSVTKIVATE